MDPVKCAQCGGDCPPDVGVGMPPGFEGICSLECFLAAGAAHEMEG